MRGRRKACKTAAFFAFREPLCRISSSKMSTKINTPVATAALVKILVSAIAEVVDATLLVLALLEGNVNINDITVTKRTCYDKRFSLCSLRGSRPALHCYFDTLLVSRCEVALQ